MKSRRWGRRALIVIAVLAVLGVRLVWIAYRSCVRVVEAGKVQVLVDKRYFGGRSSAGVGVGGQLTLTNESCVTLSGPDGVTMSYLIWDHSTDVEGEGSDLECRYAGHTVRIGAFIDGGGSYAVNNFIVERFRSVADACRGLRPLFLSELASVTGGPNG